MFDFEKLEVYKKSKIYNNKISSFLKSTKLERAERDQLKRASFSIMLNIAEGSGRYTKADKRNFYVISRGSCFECVSIIDYLHDEDQITTDTFKDYYTMLEEISKMLYSLIKGLSNQF